jgi:hypothetical protein
MWRAEVSANVSASHDTTEIHEPLTGTSVPTYSEIAPKLWWDNLSEYAQTEALKPFGGKPTEAAILAAFNRHKAEVEAELAQHPSVRGKTIPKE